MSPVWLFAVVLGYFGLLLGVAWRTSRKATNESFFIGNKNSNWVLVAFGMIGTSLSGVTFVSVPGGVVNDAFAYFQITLGYFIGYILIALVLLPLYYRLKLTSIYHYLDTRLGFTAYKTGAAFFILSRTLGATARLYLVVNILQNVILNSFGIQFWMTAAIILLMILLYTYEGGVKTIVWTDTLQTTGMLAGLLLCTFYMLQHMGLDLSSALHELAQTPTPKQFPFTQIFFTDPGSKLFWVKQILAGAFITITMTGMDQEMMQKNISVRTLRDSQKNVLTLGFTLIIVIGLFLFLGGLLHLYAFRNGAAWTTVEQNGQLVTRLFLDGKDITADNLFPAMAIRYMPPAFGIIFIIALISALFPSADGAITALTSSFCIDILGLQRRNDLNEAQKKQLRQRVHLLFAALFLVFVLFFKWVNNPSMIGVILKVAGYTYGPLLGLFSFGLLTTRTVKAAWTPFICILAPALCFFLDKFQQVWLGKFEIGLELLIINGALTFLGLWAISAKRAGQP